MSRDPIQLVRSAGASTLAQLWRIAVTFATYMVLRRWIPPAEMGIWNWAEPVFVLLAQVRDLGVPGHVVRVERRPYANYLAIQVGWGGAFALLVALGAPLLQLGFVGRDQDTVTLLRLLCLFLFVQGLASVPLTYFVVEQKMPRTIPAELARNALFAVFSLLLAWRGAGVWSIILGQVLATATYSAVLWWSARHELPLRWEPGATLPLILASLPLALMSILELAVLNLDPLIIGLARPGNEVAWAGLALMALFFVSRLLADAVGNSLYPALYAHNTVPGSSFELYRIATLLLLTFAVPASFFFFFNAKAVALVLGGGAWVDAGRYLQVAAFVPFLRPLTMFGREYLLVFHRDRLLILYTLLNLLSLGGLGYFLVHTELRELGMAVAGYFPVGQLILALGIREIDRDGFKQLVRQILELYLAGALCFAAIGVVPASWVWTRVALSALCGLIFVAAALARHGRAYRAFLALREELA